MKFSKVLITCSVGAVLLLSGCKSKINPNTNSTNSTANAASSISQDQGPSYKIAASVLESKNVKITYPKITGLNNDVENNWNNLFNNFFESLYKAISDEEPGVPVEINYDVKTQDSELISILFTAGIADQNDSEVATINIDLKNGTNRSLKDTGRIPEYAERILKGDYKLEDDSLRKSVQDYISKNYKDKSQLEKDLNTFDFDSSNVKESIENFKNFISNDPSAQHGYEAPKGFSYYEGGKLVLSPTPDLTGERVELIMD